MNPPPVYVGIDIAKKTLAVSAAGMKKEYTNTPLGHAQLIKALPEAAHVVMEATGGYERALCLSLHANAIAVSVVNPRHVRDFAKAMGQLAKSDNIDAKMIVLFAQAKHPASDQAPPQSIIELEELMARREQLVALRTIELNRKEHEVVEFQPLRKIAGGVFEPKACGDLVADLPAAGNVRHGT